MHDVEWTYVDVEPSVVLVTDVCYVVERIERAEHSRARRRCHEERKSTFRQALGNLLLQVRYDHLSSARHGPYDRLFNPLMGKVGTMVVDWCAVTFGTGRRGLNGATARPGGLVVPNVTASHQLPVYQSPYCCMTVRYSAVLMCTL